MKKLKSLIVFAVACLDVVLIALAVMFNFNTEVCFFQTGHNETSVYNWYFKPRSDGLQPQELPEFAFIKNYDAYWIGEPDEKVIYLTFDAGFENGYTPQILDALKKHNAPAAFFVVGHYMTSAPELINRMVDEGHLVCSHSMSHKDMASMSDFTAFKADIEALEQTFTDVTGKPLPKYFRPPEGKFSGQCLKYAEQLGYKSIFWSFAYCDWYEDDQPSEEEAMNIITTRTHPGAIVLLHSTSETNAKIMDQLITAWENMGYELKSLDEFPYEKIDANKGVSMD
jgi:peptidoglycan-N-acetylmuramic acid deacetylase